MQTNNGLSLQIHTDSSSPVWIVGISRYYSLLYQMEKRLPGHIFR